MLAIKPSESAQPKRVTPHILPCSIAYTGSVDSSERYWSPQVETIKQNGKPDVQVQVSYFRGRRLLGKTVDLPAGYKGVVVSSEKHAVAVEQEVEKPRSLFSSLARRDEHQDEDDEDDEDGDGDGDGLDGNHHSQRDEILLETMSEIATFQSVTVWEHEMLPSSQEPFVRGVEEWLSFAQAVHGSD